MVSSAVTDIMSVISRALNGIDFLALTHVRDTVISIKQASKENQAYHRRQTHIPPVAVINEPEQDIRGIAVFGRQTTVGSRWQICHRSAVQIRGIG